MDQNIALALARRAMLWTSNLLEKPSPASGGRSDERIRA